MKTIIHMVLLQHRVRILSFQQKHERRCSTTRRSCLTMEINGKSK